ncbi:hypothetical protein DMS41_20990 [Salmonella enterica]|uniref:hypothetical protein n=1 Tax=Salmonella enterica TaxID=28901 RepID=UPI000FB2A805|nr:hypothetical protein [Salmonella enterica]ECB7205780.1 hypothetical protein [Salmonella enterica subsp. enterica serovar Abaetetuba]ECC8858106.1 hypothetical protein [Salmonella enterica subsp. enterica]ECS6613120.1 hypothetical protein [Salmonella enterica subsp. enterica serovar Give]ECS8314508.1 hypothetical protein [Salmonella enterica subsp. enterica serovar Panama]ECT7813338.1 hypothetical protein [Salmonella enterica subsp. enterica serovar 9,12:-:1,5]EDV0418556.1 hypothetical prote
MGTVDKQTLQNGNVVILAEHQVREENYHPVIIRFFFINKKQGMKKQGCFYPGIYGGADVAFFFRGTELNCQYSLFLRVLRGAPCLCHCA